MPLKCGVDLVIELPTIYSISSAENFAEGAIKILSSLSEEVILSFGSEIGNIEVLNKFADILYHEPKEYLSLLNHELDTGMSFPKARENALLMYLNDIRKYSNILSGSNNLLGIEYLKAIKKLKSKIKPITVKREGTSYNNLEAVDGYASATAIRKMLNEKYDIQDLLPHEAYEILSKKLKFGKVVNDISVFEKEIIFVLRKMSIEQIAMLPDVNEGLENKIKEAAESFNNLDDLISCIKSKRYTRSRINRILLYALLDITKDDIVSAYKINPYIRILGTSQKGKLLLSQISSGKIPVITSVKKFITTNKNKTYKNMLEKDILATNIYTLGYEYESQANLDYTKKIVVI